MRLCILLKHIIYHDARHLFESDVKLQVSGGGIECVFLGFWCENARIKANGTQYTSVIKCLMRCVVYNKQ